MKSQPVELSLEQQFSLQSFKTQVAKMSETQSKEFLCNLYEQMLVREAFYKNLVKYEWGLAPNPEY